jgi:hypothetical protein
MLWAPIIEPCGRVKGSAVFFSLLENDELAMNIPELVQIASLVENPDSVSNVSIGKPIYQRCSEPTPLSPHIDGVQEQSGARCWMPIFVFLQAISEAQLIPEDA